MWETEFNDVGLVSLGRLGYIPYTYLPYPPSRHVACVRLAGGNMPDMASHDSYIFHPELDVDGF